MAVATDKLAAGRETSVNYTCLTFSRNREF